MVFPMEMQGERLILHTLVSGVGQISCLDHLRQYHVTTLFATFGVSHRIEIRGVLAESDQGCRLRQRQVPWFFTEIGVAGRLDTHGIMQEVEVIQIHRDDFLLGEVVLQLNGDHPLYRFLHQSLHRTTCRGRVKLLGQLLRDGRATAGTVLPQDTTLQYSTTQSNEINTGMLIETLVLGSYQGLNEVGREVVVVNHDTVLTVRVPRTHHLAVGREYLRGVFTDRVLQVIHIRHVSYPTIPYCCEAYHKGDYTY